MQWFNRPIRDSISFKEMSFLLSRFKANSRVYVILQCSMDIIILALSKVVPVQVRHLVGPSHFSRESARPMSSIILHTLSYFLVASIMSFGVAAPMSSMKATMEVLRWDEAA